MNIPEIFTKIYGFENYAVSTAGRVKNTRTNRVLIPVIRNGYHCVNLSINNQRKSVLVHRLVLGNFKFNETLLLDKKEDKTKIKTCVDHINGNKSDNRLSNLRYASKIENGQNSKKSSRNKSGVKGVSIDSERGQFLSAIVFNKERIYIGRYKTLEEAADARREVARRLFGSFCHSSEI